METVTETQAFWNSIYDSDPCSRELLPDVSRALRSAHKFLNPGPGDKLLDIGCGTGTTSLFWAQTGADVTAIDFSPSAIVALQRRCNELGVSNIRGVVGDAMKIDELGEFDIIFGCAILHHLEPFEKFAGVLRRALRTNGRAFFYENSAASRLLVWFRTHVVGKMWVPKYGDNEEFPLSPDEVDILRTKFNVHIEWPEMFFFQLASVYLLRRKLGPTMKAIDEFLYSRRIGVPYSYRQYVLLRSSSSPEDISPTNVILSPEI